MTPSSSPSWWQPTIGQTVAWALIIAAAVATVAFARADIDNLQDDTKTNAIRIESMESDVRANRESLIRLEAHFGITPKVK